MFGKTIALAALFVAMLAASPASATCPAYTYTLTNGTTADANQVMSNFNTIAACANTLAPQAGPVFTGNVQLDTAGAQLIMRNTFTPNVLATMRFVNWTGGGESYNVNLGDGNYWYFTDNGGLFFDDNGSAAVGVHFTSTGFLGVNLAAPTYPLDVTGDIRTSTCLRYSGGGTLGTCTSDLALKRDVVPFKLGLNAVAGLQPVNFYYNGLGGNPDDGSLQIGLIAQSVEAVAPQLVGTTLVKLHPKDKTPTQVKTVNYAVLTYMLINSVKELKQQNDRYAVELAALRERVATLERHGASRTARVEAAR